MKKMVTVLLIAAMMLSGICAYAQEGKEILVSLASTDECVLSVETASACNIEILDTTPLGMKTLADIQAFVGADQNAPADWFGADTAAAMQSMLPEGVNLNDLQMTEFMSLVLNGTTDEAYVSAEFKMDAAYPVGSPIVTMIGCADANGQTQWVPVSGKATEGNVIQVEFPAALVNSNQGCEVLFCAFSENHTAYKWLEKTWKEVDQEAVPSSPSITAGDLTESAVITSAPKEMALNGELDVDVSAEKEEHAYVLNQMRELVKDKPVCEFFSENVQAQMQSWLAGSDIKNLAVYEAASITCSGYQENMGNLMIRLEFASQFAEGQNLIVMLNNEAAADWFALPAIAHDGGVVVEFSSEALTYMMANDALMVVLAEVE